MLCGQFRVSCQLAVVRREKKHCVPALKTDSESKEGIEHYSPRHHDFIRRFFYFCLLDSSIMSVEFDLIGELSFSLAKNPLNKLNCHYFKLEFINHLVTSCG